MFKKITEIFIHNFNIATDGLYSVHGVILQARQYDVFTRDNSVYKKIINPLGYDKVSEFDKKSWLECYEIAEGIITGKISSPTNATHFHSFGEDKDIKMYERNIVPKGRFIKKIGQMYFYWSPN